jgi:Domain of unknown function (DUF4386)
MTSTRRNARIAGLLYLLLGAVAPLRLLYVPGKLIVNGDATATAENIAAHETLFRLGTVSELLAGVILIFLVLALYRLFKDVNHYLAVLLVIAGGIIPAAIDFFIVLNDMAALMLVRGPDFLRVFDRAQLDALAMLFLRLHGQGILAAEILWGLWLFPMGLLSYRSGFHPRFLGIWLIINGVAYLVEAFVGLLVPQFEPAVAKVIFPMLFGEVVFMLWLVIVGAKEKPVAAGS